MYSARLCFFFMDAKPTPVHQAAWILFRRDAQLTPTHFVLTAFSAVNAHFEAAAVI